MKPVIFNSLGSNYSPAFVSLSRSLLTGSHSTGFPNAALTSQLGSKPGHMTYFYKGRQAINFALQSLGVGAGHTVLAQAFTCWAVEAGITRSGAHVHFVDIPKNHLNLTVATLESAFKKATHPKAVLVQDTLGFPTDLDSISAWCRRHKLFLIRDVAHSYHKGVLTISPTHQLPDAVIFSFGRDKVIDAVSGGACWLKNPASSPDTPSPSSLRLLSDLLYPSATHFIRTHYLLGLGKLAHHLLKSTPVFTSPIASPRHFYSAFPATHAKLALFQLKHLNAQLTHRLTIARLYHDHINPALRLTLPPLKHSVCLRYPIRVARPHALLSHLKKHHFHLSDTWYSQPVVTGRLPVTSSYLPGSCPNAQDLSHHILNLPTHRAITQFQAQTLVNLINTFTNPS